MDCLEKFVIYAASFSSNADKLTDLSRFDVSMAMTTFQSKMQLVRVRDGEKRQAMSMCMHWLRQLGPMFPQLFFTRTVVYKMHGAGGEGR